MIIKKIMLITMGLLFYFTPLSFTKGTSPSKANKKRASKLYHTAIMTSNLATKEYYLRRANQFDPSDHKISYLLGKTLIRRNKVKEGEKVLLEVSKDKEYTIRVYKYLGEYFYQKSNLKKADFYLSKMLTFKGENNYINNYLLGKINGRKGFRKYKDSNRYYLKAYGLRKQKNDHDLLLYIAENYYYLRDYSMALKYLKLYPHTNKNNRKAFRFLIKTYRRLKYKKELESALKRYRKIWPKDRWGRRMARRIQKSNKKKS